MSEARDLVTRLVQAVGPEAAHQAVDMMAKQLGTVELAALAQNWRFWARPKQIPADNTWRSRGYLTGRGFGKTWANSQLVNEKAAASPILIGLCAQNEDKTIEILVEGGSGLVATAPPWCKPQWLASKKQLVWPNGSRAYAFTPEVPGAIRGPEFHLSWLTELQSWPAATMMEAHDNFMLSTRLGAAQLLWDATPKKRHPLLLERLEMAKADTRHVVVRGTTFENAENLGEGVVDDLARKLGGTSRGLEELNGEMLDGDDSALVKPAWINGHRRPLPDRFVRTAIGIDPAVTSRAGSDKTGIVVAGLGFDGQCHPLEDLSGKHAPAAWAKLVIDRYTRYQCDVVVVETNKGGDLVTQTLRAAAAERKLQVIVIGKTERAPSHQRGVMFVREVHSRGSKYDRAQPLAVAYEAGRISHPEDSRLTHLEETITTWEPTPTADSPDDLDALVSVANELLDLSSDEFDNRTGFEGIKAAAAALEAMAASTTIGEWRAAQSHWPASPSRSAIASLMPRGRGRGI